MVKAMEMLESIFVPTVIKAIHKKCKKMVITRHGLCLLSIPAQIMFSVIV